MSVCNRDGLWAFGVGEAVVSTRRYDEPASTVRQTQAGGPQFWTDSQGRACLLYQHLTWLEACVLATGETFRVPTGFAIAPAVIVARDTFWAIYAAPPNATGFETHAQIDGWHPWSVGTDGTILMSPSENDRIGLYNPDGRQRWSFPESLTEACHVSAEEMYVVTNGEIWRNAFQVLVLIQPSVHPKLWPFTYQDQPWLCYEAQAGGIVVCQVSDPSIGAYLRPGQDTFGPSAIELHGELWIGYSTNPSERPEFQVIERVTIGTITARPQPPSIPVSVAPFSRPMLIGSFVDPQRESPGNSIPRIDVDLEYRDDHDDTSAWPVARPRYVYAPPSKRHLLAPLLPGDVLLIPAYRQAHESLNVFLLRMTMEIWEVEQIGHPVVLVCGAEDFGALTEAECLECFHIYRTLVDAPVQYPQAIIGCWFFAWARANGVAKYPSFKPWIAAFAAASPGVPDLDIHLPSPPVPVPPKPRPQPPSPIPEPTPMPPTPALPVTVALDPTPIACLIATIEPHGDKVAAKRDGKYLEVDSFGHTKWADGGPTADAFARRSSNGLALVYEPAGKCFAVTIIEVVG